MRLHLFLIGFTLLCSFTESISADPHWDYGELGPDVWSDFYPTCGGSNQSPIDIKTACTTYQSYVPFQFSSGYSATQNFTLTNNGHTIAGTQVNQTTYPLTLTGGGLNDTFLFVNFHLHWGQNYKSGSEHQLNSQKFAGEIHFVHANAAQTQYAVLGFFMQSSAPSANGTAETQRRIKKRDTSTTNNATIVEWQKYFNAAGNLNTTNSSTVFSFTLSSLIGSNLNNFYRYSGSLTTPPCSEFVTWTVFQIPIQFFNGEIEEFRSQVFFEDYRGPQPSYGRPVYRSFQNDIVSAIPDENLCALRNALNNTSSTANSILLINKQSFTYFYFYILTFFLLNVV